MNIKIKSLYLACSFSSFAYAFAPGYETVSSGVGGATDIRVLANEPVALCDLDFPPIPRANCGQISLALGGQNYNRWVLLNKGIDKPETYFQDIDQSGISNLIYNYQIQGSGPWRAPTERQYYTLFNQGLVYPKPNQRFWVFDKATNMNVPYTYRPSTGGIPSPQVNSTLPRLATDAYPETDGEGLIPVGKAYFFSAFEHSITINMLFRVKWTDSQGVQRFSDDKFMSSANTVVNFNFTPGSNHQVQGCAYVEPGHKVCTAFLPIVFNPNMAGVCVEGGGTIAFPRIIHITPTNKQCPSPIQ